MSVYDLLIVYYNMLFPAAMQPLGEREKMSSEQRGKATTKVQRGPTTTIQSGT